MFRVNLIKSNKELVEILKSYELIKSEPKPVRHKKSFLIENITNLAHSYLKNLCVSSKVEPISKSEIEERLKSLRFKSKSGIFGIVLGIDEFNVAERIIKRLEKHFIKDIYTNLEARLQDIKSQIKLKENALKEASLLYDLQMAKIQAILNKIKD